MNWKPYVLLASLAVGCASQTMRGDGDTVQSASEALSNGMIFGSNLPDRTLVLSYDDGPGDRTAELSAYLRSQGIQATFFVNGSQVDARPGVLAQLAADGHLIANHTYSHNDLTSISNQQVLSEVQNAHNLIAPYMQPGHWFFRPPYMAWSSQSRAAFQGSMLDSYIGPINADIGSQLIGNYAADWACWQTASLSSVQCADLYMNEIRDRRKGIVLLHDPWGDNYGNTVDMTKVLVPRLKAEGYRFASLEDVPEIRALLPVVPVPTDAGPMQDAAPDASPDTNPPAPVDAGSVAPTDAGQMDSGSETDVDAGQAAVPNADASASTDAAADPVEIGYPTPELRVGCTALPGQVERASSWLGALGAIAGVLRRRRLRK